MRIHLWWIVCTLCLLPCHVELPQAIQVSVVVSLFFWKSIAPFVCWNFESIELGKEHQGFQAPFRMRPLVKMVTPRVPALQTYACRNMSKKKKKKKKKKEHWPQSVTTACELCIVCINGSGKTTSFKLKILLQISWRLNVVCSATSLEFIYQKRALRPLRPCSNSEWHACARDLTGDPSKVYAFEGPDPLPDSVRRSD